MAGVIDSTTQDAEQIRRARETFLTSNRFDADVVRPGVEASWRRSRFWGVDVDRNDLPYRDDLDFESRLVRAAKPVLDRLELHIADAHMVAILTDARGFVLDRRAGEKSLQAYLDSVYLAPGFTYAEKFVGTNGIGTSLEEKRPFHVFGHEHYIERLQTLSCAGAPIIDPLTGRLMGVINLTCWTADANLLMTTVVQEAAHHIEGCVFEQSAERERQLLQEFLAACQRTKRPVLSLSDGLIIANAEACQLLDADDHTIIHDAAIELTRPHIETLGEVELTSGDVAELRCRAVIGRDGVAGTLVEIGLSDDRQPRGRDMAQRRVSLPGLVGDSTAWVRVCTRVDQYCNQGLWLLLVGEPGVGKLALAQAAHQRNRPDGNLTIIDGVEVADSSPDVWGPVLRNIAEQADDPATAATTVVLRHLNQLSHDNMAFLVEMLDGLGTAPHRPWVVGTLDGEEVVGPELDGVLRTFDVSVTVPPLRHRTSDLTELVPTLLDRHAVGGRVDYDPQVMHVLLRHSWAGNVAELERVLIEALARQRVGHISLEDLPEGLHAVSPRVLTRWEMLERDAIVHALLEADGNRSEAAERLSISRATIYRKIQAYGITVEGQNK